MNEANYEHDGDGDGDGDDGYAKDRNWKAFYNKINEIGARHLAGGDPAWVECIALEGPISDFFYSDELYEAAMSELECVELAALSAAMMWLREVKWYLNQFPYGLTKEETAKLHFVRLDHLIETLADSLRSPDSAKV